MKQLKQLSYIGLALMLVLASCSIEKRHYMSGYHIEWKNSKRNTDKQVIAKKNKFDNTTHSKITKIENLDNEIITENKVKEINEEFISASTDNNYIQKNENKLISESSIIKIKLTKNLSNKKDNISLSSKQIKNNQKFLSKRTYPSSNGDEGGGALRGIGWVVLILGLLILLFASILVGALLMLLGLIFVIAGKNNSNSSSNPSNKPETPQYIDVVYLKNGGVTRGLIIEQTPNVQIKIQTKDGSIFVYKMEEIEKMTKELSK